MESGTLDAMISKLKLPAILEIAKAASWTRPLTPYPGWYFGIAEDNPNDMTKLRMAIWRYCNRRKLRRTIIVEWYDDLLVHLFLGNDTSRCLFVGGCIEPNEFAFLDSFLKPGMTFVDGGANDGLYTLFAAKRLGSKGTVLAVEPSAREVQRLRSNLTLNRLGNVKISRAALSNTTAKASLKIAGYEHEGHNTLGGFAHEGVVCIHEELVQLKRLDELFFECGLKRLDALKLDIEGAEYAALEGAKTILEEQQPLILLELNDKALLAQGRTAKDVVSLLVSMNYQIHSYDQSSGRPVLTKNYTALSSNIIAAPQHLG